MPEQKYTLVSRYRLSDLIIGFCMTTTQDIIENYAGFTIDSLKAKDIAKDFHHNLENRRDLDELISSDKFNLQLFLEVLYYVLFWADLMFQSGSERLLYFDIRKHTQLQLYTLLEYTFNFEKEKIHDLDKDLAERFQEYSMKPAENSISLLNHVKDLISGDPLIFSTAAYAYTLAVFTEIFKNVLVNRTTERGFIYQVACKNCSTEIVNSMEAAPFVIECPNCHTKYEIEEVYQDQ
ncbi:hypothetical protein KAX06_04080 [candidate division WOR-3 bacterium]|nr:hypothetical protein [candidate division WOR-3 bacterium]